MSYRCLTLSLALLATAALAEEPRVVRWQPLPEPPRLGNFVGEPGIDIGMMTEGFLSAHPDIRWRREALHSFAHQRHAEAMTYFRRAARYADKAAQAMIGEMYWEGTGVPQDRALGYVWMDLAAERQYPNFLIQRERYWHRMTEAERNDAVERGQAVFAEYGDEVAKPRLERVLRRASRNLTGSRTGFVGTLTIDPNTGPLAGTGMTIRGDEYYAAKYWSPEHYWRLRDEVWKGPPKGEVTVGDLEETDAPSDAPLSD